MTPRKPFRAPLSAVALAAVVCMLSAPPARAQPDTYKPSGKSSDKSRPSDKNKDKLKEEGRGLFGGGAEKQHRESAAAGSWSIVLVAYREEDQESAAQLALNRVRTEGGLKEAYLDKRGAATVIAVGQFPTMEAGQKDLERIRAIELTIEGEKQQPFASAFLAPPAEIKGTMPQYDLRNLRKERPWAIYTLQVGVYSREDQPPTSKELEEFRRAAEQAALQLRREGEEAFYYHGPTRSMVTIGAFGKEDFDPQTRYEVPALKQLRKRFPYNLYNGQGIKRKVTITDPKTGRVVKKEKLESSALVMVPKE